jgi:hypothetical protein
MELNGPYIRKTPAIPAKDMLLDPCPFCKTTELGFGMVVVVDYPPMQVVHLNPQQCDAKGPVRPNEEQAAMAWNERPSLNREPSSFWTFVICWVVGFSIFLLIMWVVGVDIAPVDAAIMAMIISSYACLSTLIRRTKGR